MSQALIVTGADFTSSGLGRSLYLTTDRTNLVGEYIFGRNEATTIFNSATPGSPTASVIGTLTYGDHFVDAAGANYIATNLQNNANLTFMVIVAHGAAATTELYLSSTNGAQANGFYLGNQSGQASFFLANSSGGGNAVTLPNIVSSPLTDFRALCGRASGTTTYTLEIDEFKNGSLVQNASMTATGSRVVGTQVINIGTLDGSTIWNSPKNTAAALIWHRLLSDAELLAAYLECRTVLGRMGISC
jgi:hypothetical protein